LIPPLFLGLVAGLSKTHVQVNQINGKNQAFTIFSGFILNPAVGSSRRESLLAISLQFLAKWSGNDRYCLSLKGEFIGRCGISLEAQK
jgi:hypothetical protein